MSDQTTQIQEILKKSLVTIKKLEAELEAFKKKENVPVAIVGVGVRLPGGIDSTGKLWDLLVAKKDAVIEIPKSRWDNALIYDEDPLKPGKTNAKHGAFLTNDVTTWDADFYGIVPREAKSIDPLQRMILEVTQEAFESAGISLDDMKGSRTGVYVALGNSDYMSARLRSGNLEDVDVYDATGIPFATAAGRLSYLYDLRGPNFALDAACASSIVGLHLAAEDLRTGKADCAVVASANLILSPELYVGLSKLGSLSAAGKCRAFDDHADGYVRGEGAGVIILKRLEDALADNDNVLAVIKGSAIKHDGTSNGFTAPNPEAQLEVIKEAIKLSGIEENEVDFVEAHGIGNKFTDAMEIQAIENGYKNRNTPIYMGSLKPNIGHLEAAIGMAMTFKVIESLKRKQIAPNIYFDTPNADVDWANNHVKVPTEVVDWQKKDKPLMAAINLSGYSGTNVHMIFEEAPAVKKPEALSPYASNIFNLSAKSPESLKALAEKYLADESWQKESLQDVCYTLQVGRSHYDHSLSISAENIESVKQSLEAYVNGTLDKNTVLGDPEISRSKEIAFLFTGQGAQYFGMCKELYETNAVFKNALDKCDTVLKPLLEKPILEVLFDENGDNELINQTQYTQPALFVVEYALAKMWESLGINPSAVAGHSVGEFVALTIAGAIQLEDALTLIAERGKLMQSLPVGLGGMAAVIGSETEIKPYLEEYVGKVEIAAVNSPKSLTVSGDKDAVAALVEKLKEAKIKSIPLVVSHAFHSHLMEPILQAFESAVSKVQFSSPLIPVISNVTGKEIALSDLTPQYFSKHLRGTVRFFDDAQYLSSEFGMEIFLEIGPNPTLVSLAKQGIEKESALWLGSAKKGSSDWKNIFTSLQQLYIAGIKINWKNLYEGFGVNKINLPTYAWQRKKYWFNPVRIGERTIHHIDSLTEEEPLTAVNIPGELVKLTPEIFMEVMQKEGVRILGLEKHTRLDIHKSMRDQGFDSMMSGEYLTALEKHLGTTLDISLMHLYTNMHDLHDYLCKKYIANVDGTVLMNDIILGNILGEEDDDGKFHEIKPTDGVLMRLFKKFDALLPEVKN